MAERQHGLEKAFNKAEEKACWTMARRWILVHEQQETVGVFCSGKGSKKAIQNTEVYVPKAFPALKSKRLNDEQ